MLNKVVRAIKNGDLDKLKEILKNDQTVLNKAYGWNGYMAAGLLHIAASYNQPEIVNFLVNEKHMEVSKLYHAGTPLHYAAVAKKGAAQAVEALINLGVDPSSVGYTRCKEKETREILRFAQQEQERQRNVALQEKEQQRTAIAREEARREAAARVVGVWQPVSDHEVVFERDVPGQGLRLRKIFDFAAKERLSITNDLQGGGMSQETKLFDEIRDEEGKAMLAEARAHLYEANSAVPAEAMEQEPRESLAKPARVITNAMRS